jgi:hypothetical protein
MRAIIVVGGCLLAGACGPISFSNPEPPSGYTLTCAFESGPKAGKIEHLPNGVPVPVGMACTDNAGSAGVGYRRIEDTFRRSAKGPAK